MGSFTVFNTPTTFNINALENFFLVLAALDIPFLTSTVANVWIQWVIARAEGEY